MLQNNFSQQKQLGASHETMLASFADVSGFYIETMHALH